MGIEENRCRLFDNILNEELKVAMGCTEPIAIALASSKAREILGCYPDRMIVKCSGNIIKNTRSVTVPQTGGLCGIEAAAIAGAVGGKSEKELEVLSDISEDDIKLIQNKSKNSEVNVELLESGHPLHIVVECYADGHCSSAEIIDEHANFGEITDDGIIIKVREDEVIENALTDRRCMTVKDILDYADTCDLSNVRDCLEKQIKCNLEIADEGMQNTWGSRIGRHMLDGMYTDELFSVIPWAAAGSDARMNGCSMPVVINSGSGNQGMTVSLPVIHYAQQKGVDHERLLRALCVSNLIAIHEKTEVGPVSAFCGAVSAAAGAAAGIAYLDYAGYDVICRTIECTLASAGGIICDGAKSSCAMKIALSLNAAFSSYRIAADGSAFVPGDGIVTGNVEKTIADVGRIAAKGMKSTDTEVLNIMLGN